MSGDGKGQGMIWHAQTGQIAAADNPAVGGEALSMHTTSLADGSVIPPQVIVGGRLAHVLYFGAAPGYPGYYQVNFVAGRRCARGGGCSALNLSQPAEQRSHDWGALTLSRRC
jgi:uncharacterized protein (TIGR03437 family)